jgi:hypothetical protein
MVLFYKKKDFYFYGNKYPFNKANLVIQLKKIYRN